MIFGFIKNILFSINTAGLGRVEMDILKRIIQNSVDKIKKNLCTESFAKVLPLRDKQILINIGDGDWN